MFDRGDKCWVAKLLGISKNSITERAASNLFGNLNKNPHA